MNLKQVIEHFGSKSKLAKALKTTPQAINGWGDEIPELRQYQIEVVSKRKLKADK